MKPIWKPVWPDSLLHRIGIVAVAGLALLIGSIPLITRHLDLLEEGELFASEIRKQVDAGLISVRFAVKRSPDLRKFCFLEKEKEQQQLLADAFGRADTVQYAAPTLHIMRITLDLEFADGQVKTLVGKVVETAPEDLYVESSSYIRNKRGAWQAEGDYLPIRLPGISPWLQRQFRDHGCDFM